MIFVNTMCGATGVVDYGIQCIHTFGACGVQRNVDRGLKQILFHCSSIALYLFATNVLLRSVSTTRVHGPSSRAELTARELG